MAFLEERSISCPYCGESIDILIDPPEQALGSGGASDFDSAYENAAEYIEDCQVCCRPIKIKVSNSFSGESVIEVFHENE